MGECRRRCDRVVERNPGPANVWALCLLPHPGCEEVVLVSALFLRHPHNPLMLAANKDTEQASTPWCESSPDDLRYGNLMYPDHREREKDQHEKNKRWVTVCLGAG